MTARKDKMGEVVEDKITGFSGIVTGHVKYVTGCIQYLVQPPVTKDGSWREPMWIDEINIAKRIKKEKAKPGGPRAYAPTGMHHPV